MLPYGNNVNVRVMCVFVLRVHVSNFVPESTHFGALVIFFCQKLHPEPNPGALVVWDTRAQGIRQAEEPYGGYMSYKGKKREIFV